MTSELLSQQGYKKTNKKKHNTAGKEKIRKREESLREFWALHSDKQHKYKFQLGGP